MSEFHLTLPNTAETIEWLDQNADHDWFLEEESTEFVVIAFQSEEMRDRASKELPQIGG